MAARPYTWHTSPYLLLSLTSFFWSLNWVIGRAIVGHVSPFTLAFVRWLVAVAVMLPFAWPQIRAHWPSIRRNWKTIVWLGAWGTGLHNVFAYYGLQFTTGNNGVILNSAIPVMIIVLGWGDLSRHHHARAGARRGGVHPRDRRDRKSGDLSVVASSS